MKFIKFSPVYFEKIWGGQTLKTEFGRNIDSSKKIGESWEISDRIDAQSVAIGGKFDGRTLRQILENNCEYVMGENWKASMPFPILVKWLDCRDTLSVQVHPPKSKLKKTGGDSKDEFWYFAKTDSNAFLYAGMKKKTSKSRFLKAVEEKEADKLIKRFKLKNGDGLYIPSGRIHAIGAGNLVLEIQENSDTTFRVYDWGRPRELHLEQSMQSINFTDTNLDVIHTSKFQNVQISANKKFAISKISLKKGKKICISSGNRPKILSITKGNLVSNESDILAISENAIIPASETIEFTATENSDFLLTQVL